MSTASVVELPQASILPRIRGADSVSRGHNRCAECERTEGTCWRHLAARRLHAAVLFRIERAIRSLLEGPHDARAARTLREVVLPACLTGCLVGIILGACAYSVAMSPLIVI